MKLQPHATLPLCLVVLLMHGCNQEPPPSAKPVVNRPVIAADVLQRGAQLFKTHCAECHGQQAEGAPNWTQRDADGAFPAPPLNGTGHAWHHPQAALEDTIRNGTIRLGGKMPPWKEKLSDEQVREIILWFQSKWPDELYAAWTRMDADARK